jgi:hypothetical protein
MRGYSIDKEEEKEKTKQKYGKIKFRNMGEKTIGFDGKSIRKSMESKIL